VELHAVKIIPVQARAIGQAIAGGGDGVPAQVGIIAMNEIAKAVFF